MHPRDANDWDWDAGNEGELAAHRIATWEVEELFAADPVWVRNKKAGAGEWKMVGRTPAGRPLTVVVTVNPDTCQVRAITGWDATTGEQTKYLRKRRGRMR